MRLKRVINGIHVIITDKMIAIDPDYPYTIPPQPKIPKAPPKRNRHDS